MLFLSVLNLKNRTFLFAKNTSAVILCFFGLVMVSSFSRNESYKHPFYVSVIDIKYDDKAQTMQLSIKLFSNDIEDALKKIHKKPIDIIHPKNKAETEKLLFNYIKQRFLLTINSQPQQLSFVGYEKEEEAIWVYLEIEKAPLPKNIKINTKLLFDFISDQINIVHVQVKDSKKSSKVTSPDSEIEFTF